MLAVLLLALASAPFVEKDVAVPMRDGVVLRADIYRPAEAGRFPVLVHRTPYDRRRSPESEPVILKAVERGYAVVVQDVRGRYGSAGDFVPYSNEGRDGFDTIEWAAARPWSDGHVGTFGLSYPAAVQWLAAIEAPPHLDAMAPVMTYSTPRSFIYFGGVFDLSWLGWAWENIAPDARVRRNLAGPRTPEAAEAAWPALRDRLLGRVPLSELPELAGPAPWLLDWMKRPPSDPAWDAIEVRGRYERVRAAVLNVSGWHDEAYGPEGAVTNYLGLLAARQGEADPRTELVLGPWTHGTASFARSKVGERELGPAAALDYAELVLGFLDRYVRGVSGPARKPVRVFVMGEDAWRQAEGWPLPRTRPLSLWLSGPSRGPALRGSLIEREAEVRGQVSSFVSDARKPVTDPHLAFGAHDYRALPERDDVITFESRPLESDLAVAGQVLVELAASCDAPDADLHVKLFDVAEDGTAWNLESPGSDVLRASSVVGGRLTPGKIFRLRYENLYTGNLFRKGHRVRLVITGQWFPHLSRNFHAGPSELSSAMWRRGIVSVHHGPGALSRVVLPVQVP
jgi:putative CocE/NonD family hydrolase